MAPVIEGFPYAQIARNLKRDKSVIRGQIHRAKRRIRDFFAKYKGGLSN